jgi:hypothetical protein
MEEERAESFIGLLKYQRLEKKEGQYPFDEC